MLSGRLFSGAPIQLYTLLTGDQPILTVNASNEAEATLSNATPDCDWPSRHIARFITGTGRSHMAREETPARMRARAKRVRDLMNKIVVKSLGTVTPISRPIATPLRLEIAPFEALLEGLCGSCG
jgi:hypothetical protein